MATKNQSPALKLTYVGVNAYYSLGMGTVAYEFIGMPRCPKSGVSPHLIVLS